MKALTVFASNICRASPFTCRNILIRPKFCYFSVSCYKISLVTQYQKLQSFNCIYDSHIKIFFKDVREAFADEIPTIQHQYRMKCLKNAFAFVFPSAPFCTRTRSRQLFNFSCQMQNNFWENGKN